MQTGLHPCVDARLFLVSFTFDGWKRRTNVVFIVESLLLLVVGVVSVVVVVVVAVVIVPCSIRVGHVAVQGGSGFAQESRTFGSFFASLGVVFVGGGGVAGGQYIVMGGGRRGQKLARAAQGFRGACASRGGGSFTPPSFSKASGRFRLRSEVVVVGVVGGGVRGTGVVAVG